MFGNERRHDSKPAPAAELRRSLTPRQRATLETLETFGWRLAFVRKPLFRDPMPVMVSRDRTRHVVIEGDGSIDENPRLKFRG